MADIREFLEDRSQWIEGYSAALDSLSFWLDEQEAAQQPASRPWYGVDTIDTPSAKSLGDHSLPEVDAVRERQRQAQELFAVFGRSSDMSWGQLSAEDRNIYFAAVDRLQASKPPTPHEAELLEKIRSLEVQANRQATRLVTAKDNTRGVLEWARLNADVATSTNRTPAERGIYLACATRLGVLLEELGE